MAAEVSAPLLLSTPDVVIVTPAGAPLTVQE
jgi:hypothetical protein